MVSGVDWAEAEGTLDVDFGHEGPLTQLHDGVNGVVDSRVAEWEVRHVNVIIDALPGRVGEVHDEAPFARPHSTQWVDDEGREWRGGEWACCVASLALSCQVVLDDPWAGQS